MLDPKTKTRHPLLTQAMKMVATAKFKKDMRTRTATIDPKRERGGAGRCLDQDDGKQPALCQACSQPVPALASRGEGVGGLTLM